MAGIISANFRFRSTMDAPMADGVSSITLTINKLANQSLAAVTMHGNLRVNLHAVASIGQVTRNIGTANVKSALPLIETAAGVTHDDHLAGAAIPVVTDLAGFDAFAAAISATNLVITSTSVGAAAPPGYNIPGPHMAGHVGASETDLFIGIDGWDDWSTAPLQTGNGSDTMEGTRGTDRVEGGTCATGSAAMPVKTACMGRTATSCCSAARATLR